MKAYIVELVVVCDDDDKPNEWDWDNLLGMWKNEKDGGGVTAHKLSVDKWHDAVGINENLLENVLELSRYEDKHLKEMGFDVGDYPSNPSLKDK